MRNGFALSESAIVPKRPTTPVPRVSYKGIVFWIARQRSTLLAHGGVTTVLAAKVKKIIVSAGERYKRVSFRKGNSRNDNNVEYEIIALLKGLPEDKPFVMVRELHVRLATPQPRILRAVDSLHKRGKIVLDMQLHDPLASRVSLPHRALHNILDA